MVFRRRGIQSFSRKDSATWEGNSRGVNAWNNRRRHSWRVTATTGLRFRFDIVFNTLLGLHLVRVMMARGACKQMRNASEGGYGEAGETTLRRLKRWGLERPQLRFDNKFKWNWQGVLNRIAQLLASASRHHINHAPEHSPTLLS